MSVLKNYIYNTAYQVMILLIPLVTMPYLSRVFTPDQIGLNSYTLSVVNYFMLFGMLGMQMYGNRQIAYVRDDKKKLNKTFGSLCITQLFTCSISLFAYYLFIFFLVDDNKFIYIIQGLNILSVMFDVSWLFMGLEDFKKVVIRNAFIKIFGLINIFLFIKSSDDLILYIGLTVLVNVLSVLIIWVNVPKYIDKFEVDKSIVKGTFKPLLNLFLPQIASQVYTLLARTMVGVFSTNEQVAFYDYSQKIVRIILALVTSIGVVLMPKVANTIAQGKEKEVYLIVEKAFKFVSYISIPMAVGLMVVSQKLVSWFLGPEYGEVGQLTSISSIIIIAVSWANVIGIQYLVSTKQENKYTISIVVAAITNLIMNISFIGLYGAKGAIISLIVAEFLGVSIQMILVRKEFPIKRMLLGIIKYFVGAVIMGVIVNYIGSKIVNGILANLVQGVSGVVIYMLIMALIKDEVQHNILKKVLSIAKKKKLLANESRSKL